MTILHLRKRAEFVSLTQKGVKAVSHGLVLQAKESTYADFPAGAPHFRVGFTVTKQVGNAVIRNRVKRRLRAVAQQIMPLHAKEGVDYVLIGRQGTLNRSFTDLLGDMKYTLKRTGSYRE